MCPATQAARSCRILVKRSPHSRVGRPWKAKAAGVKVGGRPDGGVAARRQAGSRPGTRARPRGRHGAEPVTSSVHAARTVSSPKDARSQSRACSPASCQPSAASAAIASAMAEGESWIQRRS